MLIRKNTHWKVTDTKYRFEIVDLYGTGFKNNYTVTQVVLKYSHLPQTQTKPADMFLQLIENRKIERI